MKITPLEPTGDAFKVLYQDEKTFKGFIVGLSGTLTAVWGLKTDEEKLKALNIIAENILDIRDVEALDDIEKIYTTNDTSLPFDLAVPEIARNFCREAK